MLPLQGVRDWPPGSATNALVCLCSSEYSTGSQGCVPEYIVGLDITLEFEDKEMFFSSNLSVPYILFDLILER